MFRSESAAGGDRVAGQKGGGFHAGAAGGLKGLNQQRAAAAGYLNTVFIGLQHATGRTIGRAGLCSPDFQRFAVVVAPGAGHGVEGADAAFDGFGGLCPIDLGIGFA